MSKVLTQQNALPTQQLKKIENHKKTTPTVQMLNSNCNSLNSGISMRGTTANSVVCSSESPSTSSSPITVDCDDFTSSSILEFLAREQECCTEADTESIFQEVSRLADNSDTRSVDEILREAELLMQQSIFGCTDRAAPCKQLKVSGGNKSKSNQLNQPQPNSAVHEQIQQSPVATQNIKLNSKYTKRIENVSPTQKQMQTVPHTRLTNGNCTHKEKMKSQKNGLEYSVLATADATLTATNTPQTPTAATPIGNQRFDAFVDNLPSVSVISEESTPKDMQTMMSTDADVTTMALLNGDDDDTDTMEEITEGIENIELILNDEGQPVEVNNAHSSGSNAVDEVSANNYSNELEDDADGDADTLSADGSSLDANTAENAANTATTTTTFYTGHLSGSSSSSVMSTSLHIAAQTKLKQSEDGNVNVTARRPSFDAMLQHSQQHQQQPISTTQQAHSVNYASQTQMQLVGGSPARRNPLTFGGLQHSSPSMLERRSSGGYCASAQRSSMTTPDSGISQTQSSQSCTPGPYSPHRMLSTTLPAKTYCDKSVNSSPKRMISALTSPIEPFAANVGREHALKHEIEQLQEKLKDTEERLKSLRIQHDSLSQLHRDLRESNTKLQEESEMLKLDVQHLNECANILRTELQTARADRDEALHLQKTLQGELEENRQDRKRTQELKDKEAKTIQDLQRQCREMERILMRKHPDSVSALIVASKNSGKCASNDQENVNSRKLLEQRIAQLESDAKEQDLKAQQILANVQARFNSVQSKYETHIADLETQVLSLQEINTKLNEKIESQVRTLDYFVSKKAENFYNNCTQTDANVVADEHEAGCSGDITKRASVNTTGDRGNANASTTATANANNNCTNTTGTQTVQTKNTRDHSTNTIGTSSTVHSASSSTSSTANSTPNTSRPNSKQSGIRKPFATAMGTLSSALASKLPVSHSDLTISAHHAHASAKEDAHLLATIRGMRVDLAIKDKAMQRLTRELEECKKTIKKLQREKDAQKSDKSQWNSYTCLNIARRSHEALHHNQAHSDQMPATTESQTLREAQNKLKLLESDYKILHDKRLNDLKTLQSAHERELASCHETVRVLQQRLNERDEAFATQKRRKLPVDYYALKAKVSSLERRHSEREERLRMLVDALSKGRLTGAIEDLLGDNNNQRST
ncbi:serine-rich adhesin for platelets [Bactrocera oleae]|uniref:serine-rich adhesin for platelets n=1 Tax=Bactrocera oleae TaxID=104688 RepID=UPI00387E7E32